MGLKPKLTYVTVRNPHEDFSEDEVDSQYPNIPQDHQSYKKVKKQEDLQWSPPTRRQERNRSLTTGRRIVDGAPPPDVISAHARDDLTHALVVRKRRGLSRQI
jgi:hypothetical protein